MKAQVFRGVNQLSYEEVPVPHLKPEEVLVQVRVVGLCQSDIKKIRYPLYEPPRIFWTRNRWHYCCSGFSGQRLERGRPGSSDASYTLYALRLLPE